MWWRASLDFTTSGRRTWERGDALALRISKVPFRLHLSFWNEVKNLTWPGGHHFSRHGGRADVKISVFRLQSPSPRTARLSLFQEASQPERVASASATPHAAAAGRQDAGATIRPTAWKEGNVLQMRTPESTEAESGASKFSGVLSAPWM